MKQQLLFKAFLAAAAVVSSSGAISAYTPGSANSPLLYGYNDGDGWYSVSPLPSGMCSMQTEAGGEAIPLGALQRKPSVGAYAGGKYYAIASEYNWLTGEAYYLDVYDADGWGLTSTQQLSGIAPRLGLAVTADGKTAYTISNVGWDPHLFLIDLSTLEATDICEMPSWLYLTAMALGPDGNIISFNTTDGHIYSTDPATGETTDTGMKFDDGEQNMAATFDHHSGLIYVVSPSQDDYMTHVFTVDMTGQAVTDLGPTPGGEYLKGIYIDQTDGAAPDCVTGISFAYAAPGSNDCTITFTMPTAAYGGADIQGDLSAVLIIDGAEEAIAASKGETLTLPRTFADGNHTVRIFAEAGGLRSTERRFSTFTGQDLPAAVENLSFCIDGGVVSLSWDAPSRSANGGEYDKEAITYTVIREPNSVTVATGLKETSFEETLTDAFAYYSYRVIPCIGDKAGVPSETEQIMWGSVNVPPFVEDFDNYGSFDRFTAVSVPETDGSGWNSWGGDAHCSANTETAADYFLFTPEIRLDAAQTYTLTFNLRNSSYSGETTLFDVALLSDQDIDPEAGEPLVETFTLHPGSRQFTRDFTVDESGIYFIRFRNSSEIDGPQLSLDDIAVAINSSITAASAPTGLLAKAGAKGATNATITGAAPTATLDGKAIDGIDRIVIMRNDGAEIARIEGLKPGESFEATDGDAPEGFVTYGVTAYSGGEKGMTLHATTFIGADTPLPVANLKANLISPEKAELTWDFPGETGVNGGYVDPETVTYDVSRMDDISDYWAPTIAYGIAETAFTDDFFLPEGQRQQNVKYMVTAINDNGDSAKATLTVTLGEAYTLPFAESFSDGTYDCDAWDNLDSSYTISWKPLDSENTTVAPYDRDNGLLAMVYTGEDGASCSLRGPKVSLIGARSPKLTFRVWDDIVSRNSSLAAYAVDKDANETLLGEYKVDHTAKDWSLLEFPLDAFIGQEINVVLRGSSTGYHLYIDNLRIVSTFGTDAELTNLTLPESVAIGAGCTADAEVTNAGSGASAVEVTLYKNGIAVSSETIESLEPGATATVTLDMGISVEDAYTEATYRAEVTMTGDENTTNDSSREITVFVKGNTLPTVALEGEQADGAVALTWNKPEARMAVETKDGFEDCESFALDEIGDWIVLDADGAPTEFSKFWSAVPNAKSPMAWEVWDDEVAASYGFFDFGVAADSFSRSGDKCLAAFTAIENSWFGEAPSANDNWLISPDVVGATDITFWLCSLQTVNDETIEVLYTTEADIDNEEPDVTSFILLKEITLKGNDWRKYSFTLPLEAKHFAIRHTTQYNGHIVLLDDISYTPAYGDKKKIEAKGYNVYRDGEVIATVDTESYTDVPATDGTYRYYVTSLWNEGESCISNVFKAEIETGVDAIAARGLQARGEKGRILLTADTPAEVTVSDINGAVIFRGNIDGRKAITAAPGVYMATFGRNTVKLIVK